eukprot:gene18047-21495_t
MEPSEAQAAGSTSLGACRADMVAPAACSDRATELHLPAGTEYLETLDQIIPGALPAAIAAESTGALAPAKMVAGESQSPAAAASRTTIVLCKQDEATTAKRDAAVVECSIAAHGERVGVMVQSALCERALLPSPTAADSTGALAVTLASADGSPPAAPDSAKDSLGMHHLSQSAAMP